MITSAFFIHPLLERSTNEYLKNILNGIIATRIDFFFK